MISKRLYIDDWKSLFLQEEQISKARILPGNFYKIKVYKYKDNNVKVLSGIKTSYIFVIGRYKNENGEYIASLKLSNVKPDWFFKDIKLALKNNPLTENQIDRAYEKTENEENTEFKSLLKKFSKDGKKLFAIIKTKRKIYEGNYREYKIPSIKNVSYLDINSEYLKSTLAVKKNKKS